MSTKKPRIKYQVTAVNGVSVAVHRVVMEAILGRKLLPNEHVHHIDNNGLNNSVDNLMVLSPKEHAAMHKKRKILKPGMNELIFNAIDIAGGQANLAEMCNVSQAAVSKWLRGGVISVENAIAVENSTHGAITAKELRQDVAWPSSSIPMTKNQLIEKLGSQAELARAAGVTDQAASQWDGEAMIPLRSAVRVAKATGLKLHELRPDLFGDDEQVRAGIESASGDTA